MASPSQSWTEGAQELDNRTCGVTHWQARREFPFNLNLASRCSHILRSSANAPRVIQLTYLFVFELERLGEIPSRSYFQVVVKSKVPAAVPVEESPPFLSVVN